MNNQEITNENNKLANKLIEAKETLRLYTENETLLKAEKAAVINEM